MGGKRHASECSTRTIRITNCMEQLQGQEGPRQVKIKAESGPTIQGSSFPFVFLIEVVMKAAP